MITLIEKETNNPNLSLPESTRKQRLWTFNFVMQRLLKRLHEHRNQDTP